MNRICRISDCESNYHEQPNVFILSILSKFYAFANYSTVTRSVILVGPRYYAEGQRLEWGFGSPADAHLDHVPEISGRPGNSARRRGQACRESVQAAIEPPYRWRDWAAKSDGITGDELLSFINSEEGALPHGPTEKPKRGPGLFRYLRLLTSSDSAGVADTRRDVIATVFKGVQNRMVSGYLLRDVINKLNGIHFTTSDELHTLGALYESMLREMRDAAGDSGEFYTPRAVVRFMVAAATARCSAPVHVRMDQWRSPVFPASSGRISLHPLSLTHLVQAHQHVNHHQGGGLFLFTDRESFLASPNPITEPLLDGHGQSVPLI